MLRIRHLIWSRAVINKIARKHNVERWEVKDVCYSKHLSRKAGKNLYDVYGRTEVGRYLLVVLSDKGHGFYKVVTARDMTNAERQYYRRRR